MAISVTLVGTRNRELEDMLRTAGMRATTVSSGELSKLAHPSAAPPDVVVLDLRDEPHVPPALAMLKRQHPGVGVAIVASKPEPALILEAMRAGVSECVTDLTGGDLEAAITRLVAQKVSPEAGEMYAFVGAKGGVGATTAAVNVAASLAKSGSTLFIDLHITGGEAALLFGAEPRFSVTDALENTHRLDAAYFGGLVAHTKAGVDLLASSERPMLSRIDTSRIRTLLDYAARHYRYTVIDVPRSDATAIDALESTTVIAVVANQELATVRASARIALMLRHRYGKDRVQIVLSRSDRMAEIDHGDLEHAVGAAVTHIFPSDYRLALDAMNRGRPLVLENQTSLAAAYQAYARDLSGVAEEPESPRPGLFGRLTGRK